MHTIELNLRLNVRGLASTAADVARRQDQALALLGTARHRRCDKVERGAGDAKSWGRVSDPVFAPLSGAHFESPRHCLGMVTEANYSN